MREQKFKQQLINQARIAAGQQVLDLGCGTGTLTIMIKHAQPAADVIGLDGDPRILDVARAKAAKANVSLTLDHGLAFQLPYPDRSFDRVLSILVVHHLTLVDKHRTLRDVYRVLRLEQAADNVNGLLPELFQQTRLVDVEVTARYTTVFGGLWLYRTRKGVS